MFMYISLMGDPLVINGRTYDESDWKDLLSVEGRQNYVTAQFCHNGHVDRYVEFVFQQVFIEELGLSDDLAKSMLRTPLQNPTSASKSFTAFEGGFYIKRTTSFSDSECPSNTWSSRILVSYEG